MDIKETVGSVLKELIVPELNKIKEENKEIKTPLILTNERLDDINPHLADQSRRIDSVREELNKRIDSVKDELTKRIDRLYEVIVRRDEHFRLDQRVAKLERELNDLKRMAA
jgi:transcription antitermination factor NusA-like protein